MGIAKKRTVRWGDEKKKGVREMLKSASVASVNFPGAY